jgi:hypothetical protein
MRRLAVLPLAAVAFAFAAPATAKEVQRVQVCGRDGCVDAPVPDDPEALVELGTAAAGPSRDGPGFLRVRITVGDGVGHVRITQLYVPDGDLVAVRDDARNWSWSEASGATAAALRTVVRGVPPLPASRLPAGAARSTPPAAPARPVSRAGDGGLPAWAVIAAVAAVVALAARGGWTALRPPRR